MHKNSRSPSPKKTTKRAKRRYQTAAGGFTPLAGRLMLTGSLLITLGVCDVAARAYEGMVSGEIGLFLRLCGDVESLYAAAAVLVGGGLLLDLCERMAP